MKTPQMLNFEAACPLGVLGFPMDFALSLLGDYNALSTRIAFHAFEQGRNSVWLKLSSGQGQYFSGIGGGGGGGGSGSLSKGGQSTSGSGSGGAGDGPSNFAQLQGILNSAVSTDVPEKKIISTANIKPDLLNKRVGKW